MPGETPHPLQPGARQQARLPRKTIAVRTAITEVKDQ